MTRQSLRHALSWLLLGAFLWCLYQVLQPFFDPLAWAAVLAIFFAPMHQRIRTRLHDPTRAAFFSTLAVTLILIVPTMIVLQALVREGLTLFNDSHLIIPRVWDFLQKLESRVPWNFLPVDGAEQVVAQATAWGKANVALLSARLAGNLAQVFFELTVIIFALFYFFRDGEAFIVRLSRISVIGDELRERLLSEMVDTVQVTVSAMLMVAAIQGGLGAFIFLVLGLASPILWGVIMGLASVVPVFGTALVWAPQGLWLIVNGSLVKGVILLLFGALIISSADNVLRSVFITGKSQLNALLVFIAVVGGIQAFGGVGAVLGPVLLGAMSALFHAYDAKAESLPSTEPIAQDPG